MSVGQKGVPTPHVQRLNGERERERERENEREGERELAYH